MQCDAFHERLNEVMDQRRSPKSDHNLVAHARCCAPCFEMMRMWERLGDALEFDAATEEPLDDCVQAAGGARRPQIATTGFSWLGAIAIAIVVLLMIGSNWRHSSDQPHVMSMSNLDLNSISVETDPIEHITTDLTEVQSASSAFAHQPLISFGLLSTADWSYAINEVQMPFGAQLPAFQPEWIGVVSEPVQQSMSKTLDAIRRSLSS